MATGCSVGVNDIRGTRWDGYKLVMDQCDISYNMVTCGYDPGVGISKPDRKSKLTIDLR